MWILTPWLCVCTLLGVLQCVHSQTRVIGSRAPHPCTFVDLAPPPFVSQNEVDEARRAQLLYHAREVASADNSFTCSSRKRCARWLILLIWRLGRFASQCDAIHFSQQARRPHPTAERRLVANCCLFGAEVNGGGGGACRPTRRRTNSQ